MIRPCQSLYVVRVCCGAVFILRLMLPIRVRSCFTSLYVKLIAFELAGKDRDRRETPVLSRLKIAFFALHKRG